MRGFLRQAEDILEIAVCGEPGWRDLVIVMDRQGGMRMLDPAGWSLPALSAEFGAAAVYRVEKRSQTVRVEGWNGADRCLLQRDLAPPRLTPFAGMGAITQAMMLLPAAPATT